MQYITIAVDEKSFARMVAGLRVEGTVGYNPNKGIGDLNAFNRKKRVRPKDRLVKKLPWGWVKESLKQLKVFASFPKDLTLAELIELLNEHARSAKNALIEREIIERV